MPSLFGVDIAGIVAEATAGQLVPATLIRSTPTTRTPGQLTGGLNPATASYACEGIIEDYADYQIDGTRILAGDRRILLIAGSIASGIIPQQGDQVTIEGATLDLVRVTRDPAAASYTCQARSG